MKLHIWACKHVPLIRGIDKAGLLGAIVLIMLGLAIGGCSKKAQAIDWPTMNFVCNGYYPDGHRCKMVGKANEYNDGYFSYYCSGHGGTSIKMVESNDSLLQTQITALFARLSAIEQRLETEPNGTQLIDTKKWLSDHLATCTICGGFEPNTPQVLKQEYIW